MTACSHSPAEKEAKFLSRGKVLLGKNDAARALLEFRNAARAMPQDAEPYYQSALTYLQLKDGARAVAALRKALELSPNHSQAQLKLAELMATSTDPTIVEDAKKRLDTLLGESPGNVDVLNALAVTEARLGKLEDAQRHIEEALAKAPARLKSSILLARLKLKQGDAAGAEAALQQAVQKSPKSADGGLALASFYLARQRVAEGEAEVRRVLHLEPQNGVALQTLAAIQMSRGDSAAAGDTYRLLSTLADKRYRPLHALFLFEQGKREDALAEFEKLAAQDPKDREIRTRLVAAYIVLNRVPAAEKVLATALKEHANDTDALFQQAALFLRQGKYIEAKNNLLQVIHFRPDFADARYALSRAELGLGSSTGQRYQLNEALRLNPNLLVARTELSRILIAAGEARSAVELMDGAPGPQKGLLPARVARIGALLGAGDQPAARKEIDQALALGRVSDVLLQDAALRAVQKDYRGARASLDEVLKKDPEWIDAWRLLSQTYAAEKQLPKAAERLQAAVLQHPNSARLHSLLADVLLAEGKRKEAETALSAATAADPGLVTADLLLAQLEQEDGAPDSARHRLIGVLDRNPKNIAAMLMLGDLENKAGNRPGAIARYRSAVATDGKNAMALNNLAFLLAKDEPEQALTYAQQAADLQPDNSAVEDTLGWIYYRMGRYQIALAHLKNAVSHGNSPLRSYHLGIVYLKVGDRDQGQKTLQSALAADPTLAKKVDW